MFEQTISNFSVLRNSIKKSKFKSIFPKLNLINYTYVLHMAQILWVELKRTFFSPVPNFHSFDFLADMFARVFSKYLDENSFEMYCQTEWNTLFF